MLAGEVPDLGPTPRQSLLPDVDGREFVLSRLSRKYFKPAAVLSLDCHTLGSDNENNLLAMETICRSAVRVLLLKDGKRRGQPS
jgi:hypothetical protein